MNRKATVVLPFLLAAVVCAQSPATHDEDKHVITWVSVGPSDTGPISMRALQSSNTATPHMRFGAKIACPGKQDSCRPAWVELRLTCTTERWCIADQSHSIRFIIDNKFAGSGEFSLRTAGPDGHYVCETATLVVQPSVLEQIAKAKSVEVQLGGDISFFLSPQNLSDARELAAHVIPPKDPRQ